jgi:hypothetical protein
MLWKAVAPDAHRFLTNRSIVQFVYRTTSKWKNAGQAGTRQHSCAVR